MIGLGPYNYPSHFYRHLTKLLVESIESQKQQFETTSLCDIDEVFSSTTIREFDTRCPITQESMISHPNINFSRFTAPMFGYSSWREYYAAARLADKLASIKVCAQGASSIQTKNATGPHFGPECSRRPLPAWRQHTF